jgi:hypothetical protein
MTLPTSYRDWIAQGDRNGHSIGSCCRAKQAAVAVSFFLFVAAQCSITIAWNYPVASLSSIDGFRVRLTDDTAWHTIDLPLTSPMVYCDDTGTCTARVFVCNHPQLAIGVAAYKGDAVSTWSNTVTYP